MIRFIEKKFNRRYITVGLYKDTAQLFNSSTQLCLGPGYILLQSERLHDGDLHAVGCGEGPVALVNPVKAIRVGVGL